MSGLSRSWGPATSVLDRISTLKPKVIIRSEQNHHTSLWKVIQARLFKVEHTRWRQTPMNILQDFSLTLLLQSNHWAGLRQIWDFPVIFQWPESAGLWWKETAGWKRCPGCFPVAVKRFPLMTEAPVKHLTEKNKTGLDLL